MKENKKLKIHLTRNKKRNSKIRQSKLILNNFKQLSCINLLNKRNRGVIETLPTEVLCKIFSYFDLKTLFINIRLVCKRWFHLAMSPILWRKIDVINDVPTYILSQWIESSFMLKELSMKDRNDANVLTKMVSKYCKNLEKINLVNCWGSRTNPQVHSLPLCNLVTRCHKLYYFNFAQTKFTSCKFFKLLSKMKTSGKIVKKCNYFGPMNSEQINALFSTLMENDAEESATIGNGDFKQKIKIKDIMQYIRSNFIFEGACANFNIQIAHDNDRNNHQLQINI